MAPPRRAAGFNLVELMISVTIGLFIVMGLAGVVSSTSSSRRSNDRTSELQTNGRYALETLRQELRQAGHRGYTWADSNTPSTVLTSPTITGECLPAGAAPGSFVSNLRQGVWGANNTNPFSATCISSANFAAGSGDVLVIRRLVATPVCSLVGGTVTCNHTANTFYYRSGYAYGEMFRGIPATACTVLPQSGYAAAFGKVPCLVGTPVTSLNDYALQVFVYYISPYTNSADESPQVPALYRVALQPNGTMTPELVASGIERLHVQFARATTDLNTRYYNANDIAGGATTATATDWDDVNSVRVWLLARNSTAELGYSNTNTYAMGDENYTVDDGFRRQLFSSVVQLRN